jgi:heme exporter protein C
MTAMRSTLSTRLVPVLLGLSVVMFAAAPYVIDTAPYESTMGLVQRIFYFHMPAAWLLLITSMVCGVASALYLWRRQPLADHVAVAAAELAVVFGVIVLVTGPLWARKAWNVWWIWDARITSTFVMWMVFNAYVLLRRFGGAGSEVLSAAVGFFGMVLVPFIFWSVNMWRTLHPKTSVVPTLPVDMGRVVLWCLVAFLFWYVALMILRVRLEGARQKLDEAYLMVED